MAEGELWPCRMCIFHATPLPGRVTMGTHRGARVPVPTQASSLLGTMEQHEKEAFFHPRLCSAEDDAWRKDDRCGWVRAIPKRFVLNGPGSAKYFTSLGMSLRAAWVRYPRGRW